MANRIMDEVRESFRQGSTLTKLIYVNIGVFLVVKLIYTFYFLSTPSSPYVLGQTHSSGFTEAFLQYLMVSSNLEELIMRPWTIITYMFLHEGFLHILFNMLWLFWFGRIFLRYLNQKQLLTTYLLGGIFGAGLYVLAYNLLPGLSYGLMLGASASVSAIVLAISFYVPNYTLNLMFFGEIKLKHIAIAFVVLDVLQIAGDNPGGHIAHLGGALYGYLFAVQLKRGKDTGRKFALVMDSLASMLKRQPKMKVSYKSEAKTMTDQDYNRSKAQNQKEVDKILDKIAKSGYESLTKKEKEILFKMSDKK
jgi:membrane associated rhomboid family serine protease